MIWPADQALYRLALTLLAASAALVSRPTIEVVEAAETQDQAPVGRSIGPQREAPVFTYRQFTAKLPPLAATPDQIGPGGAPSFGPSETPSFPAPEPVLGRDQANTTDNSSPGGDAAPERPAPAAARAEQAAPSPGTSGPAVAGAERPSQPESPIGRHADARKAKLIGSGRASWYQHPGKTANGEVYNPNKLTAAHHSLPFGTLVKVVNKQNGRSVVVKITDRTNEHTKAKRNYAIDLSRASAQRLGIEGIGQVALYQID